MILNKKTSPNDILIQLIVRDTCRICHRVKYELEQIAKNMGLNLQVFDLENGDTIPDYVQPFITPAIWVNGSLWYLGGFEKRRFLEKISQLVFNHEKISHHFIVSS